MGNFIFGLIIGILIGIAIGGAIMLTVIEKREEHKEEKNFIYSTTPTQEEIEKACLTNKEGDK